AQVSFTPALEEGEMFAGGVQFPDFAEVCKAMAQQMFLGFIQSSTFNRVGRCRRCSTYFYNRSGHTNKVYCSGPCARAASAREAKERKREYEETQRLARVNAAVVKFRQLSDEKRRHVKKPKRWIAEHAEVTPHFITRAQRSGKLPVNLA